jgi:hypothetical protein
VDWAGHNGSAGRPFHHTELRAIGHDISGKEPGKHWVDRLLARHPELRPSRPSGLDPKRAAHMNKAVIMDYMAKLRDIDEEYDGIPPGHYWNMDEKGVQLGGGRNGGKKKFMFMKDIRDKYRIKSDSLELVTVIECVSAAGESMPPAFVLSQGPQPDLCDVPSDKISM